MPFGIILQVLPQVLYHCDMKPVVEELLVQQKHQKADYSEPFPTVFGSLSR